MNNFLKFIFATIICALSTHLKAQQTGGKITGVISGNGKVLESVTVSLLKYKDSSLIKMAVTDKAGNFELEKLPAGKYLVMVTAVGYAKTWSQPLEIGADLKPVVVPAIALTAASKELGNVNVIAKKPLVEYKIDRMVVNVDASPTNTGISALEVLEKSPGISVDKDGNISLKGKSGVMVLIDGKPSYLGGSDLVNLLRAMPSNQLEQLEIMTNPPARFDASGNAGVINIKTKKNKARGFNGNLSLGGGFGYYGKSNNSLNLNLRQNKWNLFTNYSYSFAKNRQRLDLDRNFRDQQTNALKSAFEQQTSMITRNTSHNLKLGADFYASKKTTLGIVFNGFINPRIQDNFTNTYIFAPDGQLTTHNVADADMRPEMKNYSINVNFRHQFDSTGRELTADADYAGYRNTNAQLFNNLFYDKNGIKTQPDELLSGNLPSNINIYSGRVDYTHPLKSNAKFEAGLKTSVVKTDNDAQYAMFENGEWKVDRNRSNHFIYEENINAAYVNGSKQFTKKWGAQLGLRLENTIAKGNQVTSNQQFSRNYTQLFPTAYLSFTPNDKNNFVLNYGRRIQRPNYESMNPFIYFLDKYTYNVGNPYLRPQFSHNVELSHTFKGFLTTTLNYSKTTDIMNDVLEQVDSTNTTFLKKSNIAKSTQYGIAVNAGMPVTKWWRTNIYVNASYNQYSGVINNGFVEMSAPGLMTNIQNSFTFKKGWGGEVSGFFRSKMVEGVLTSRAMGVVNFGISKQVLKNQGSIRLNVRDLFGLQVFRGYSKYQNIDVSIRNQKEFRVFQLSFNYRFGKPIKDTRQRRTRTPEELNRVGS